MYANGCTAFLYVQANKQVVCIFDAMSRVLQQQQEGEGEKEKTSSESVSRGVCSSTTEVVGEAMLAFGGKEGGEMGLAATSAMKVLVGASGMQFNIPVMHRTLLECPSTDPFDLLSTIPRGGY